MFLYDLTIYWDVQRHLTGAGRRRLRFSFRTFPAASGHWIGVEGWECDRASVWDPEMGFEQGGALSRACSSVG